MTPRPLGKRIIILPVERQTKTPAGIYLPDNGKDKPVQGTIVAKSNRTVQLQGVPIGSSVLYSHFSGTNIEFRGKPHLIMHEDEVLAVLSMPKGK